MEVKLGGAEEHFAKKLANNDKKIRDRAVKRLQTWLASRPSDSSGFCEVELLKIWKGLFYCFWMSDKPLIQEELAVNISQLLHSFKNIDSGFSFISSFFKTVHREWHGIDRLRLDKFYMLIRFFIRENFEFLKRNNWKSSLCKRLATIYQNGPLNATSESVPVGIQLHLCSIFLSELQSIKCNEILSEVVMMLLEPFFILAAQTKRQVVLKAVKDGVLEKMLEIGLRKAGDSEDEDGNSEMGGKTPLMINFQEITEKLFNLASNRDILSRNRNMLFLYTKIFKKQHPGTLQNGGNILGKRKAENLEDNEDALNIKKGKKHKKTKTVEKENKLNNNNNNEVLPFSDAEKQESIVEKTAKRNNFTKTKDDQQCHESNREAAETIDQLQGNTINEQSEVSKKDKRKMRRSGPMGDQQNEENVSKMDEEDVAAKTRKKNKKSKPQNESLLLNVAIEMDIVNKEEASNQAEMKKSQKTDSDQTEKLHLNGALEDKTWKDEETTNNVTPKRNKKPKKRKTGEGQENNDEPESILAIPDSTATVDHSTSEKDLLDKNQNQQDTNGPSSKKKSKRKSYSHSNNSNTNDHEVDKNNEQMNADEHIKHDVISQDSLDKALKDMRDKISNKVSTPKDKNTPPRNPKTMTPHAFVTFTKTKTPPAYVKKTKPQTEPRKVMEKQLSTPKSAPSKKKVTIQLSKNVAQTPLEYVNKLKTSPSIPFNANVSPAFGLLKDKSPHSTPKKQKLMPMKRSKAVDFF